MKTFKNIFTIALVSSILASCSLENSFIQKRKYKKGYHVSLKKKNSSNQYLATEIDNQEIADNFSNDETQNLPITDNSTENISSKNTEKSTSINVDKKSETLNNKTELEPRKTNSRANISFHINNSLKPIVKNNTTSRKPNSTNDDVALILLVILAFLLPPIAVGLYTNWDTNPLVISIILTLLFWVPGIIHALLVIFDVI